jgi:hypothetical protein
MKDVAYLTIKDGPRTLLNFVSSYGTESSSQTTPTWDEGLVQISFDYRQNGFYFLTTTMKLFAGDGTAGDPSDWVLFNFGPPSDPAVSDWNPQKEVSGYAFFGGKPTIQGLLIMV